jgi:alpha-1,6-mannosyltransferase
MLVLCNLPETGHLLIAAGRLSAEKRWPMVVDAVVAAGNELPVGLMLFGAGSEEAKIRRAIKGNPHIQLMGTETNRQNFAAFMASADALIHGCEAETFCMAAAEARASGTPVIGPDKGGAADHASHGGQTYVSGNALSASRAILRHFRCPSANGTGDVISIDGHFRQLFDHYASLRHPVRQAG